MNFDNCIFLSAHVNDENSEIQLTIESFICIFVYVFCESDTNIYFVDDEESDYQYSLSIPVISKINYLHLKNNQLNELKLCFPTIQTDQKKLFISGLCAVLRWLVKDKLSKVPEHSSQSLLGFRGGCLVACTESSIWTKFCELQLPSTVYEISSHLKHKTSFVKIPENLVLLEAHFKRPVRTHNILKRKLDIAKKVKKGNISAESESSAAASEFDVNFTLLDDKNQQVQKPDLIQNFKSLVITEKTTELDLNHNYLEGIDLTLADMIVFPCVHYCIKHLPASMFQNLEKVSNWYKRMVSNENIKIAAEKCGMSFKKIDESLDLSVSNEIIVPEINQDSLYKRDPSHTKIRIKHQNPSEILLLLKEFSISPIYAENYCSKIDWESLPSELHPATGDLPKKRIQRKCQQIESIVTAVLKIAIEGQTIVEFCSGGGHVGLLLAYFLPKCRVILIENKESSMQRAIFRAKALKLNNLVFYQCNLDYFKHSFDMGVTLHACGVATDLVIQQCIQQRASFICCPCCYGGIQNTHLLNYPLSKVFCDTGITYKKYTLLAHCADRTEVNTPTADQGELCMGLIDTDRSYFAQEKGYSVELTTLQPKSCSPKHNLLIGISPKWNKSISQ